MRLHWWSVRRGLCMLAENVRFDGVGVGLAIVQQSRLRISTYPYFVKHNLQLPSERMRPDLKPFPQTSLSDEMRTEQIAG